MHGLSTLNRLLGKKNKEVSRSTSNLSKSHSNLESSSQHNQKIPILNNAPFEQTFRVTVYLPKNQLYVERIGAKTKLAKLMNDVCDSKNLNIDKYEFRHPADMSQVFDNDKTIGEVGLNELRLVMKTESRFNADFHRYHSQPEDIMSKYKSNTVPESISSSEISRSNLKNVSKTSPYSSTNSLNSLDSTGMNSNSTTNKVQPPVAPLRKKKRMAPRPPSENSIPEQEIFSTSTLNVFKEPHSILPRKNFHVSSPQLYSTNSNINNNFEIAQKSDSNNNTELRSVSNRLNAITRPSSMHISTTRATEIVKHLPERQRNNSESSEIQNILRDSGSKQNSLERAKKKSPAPVPPTRKMKPTPSPRTIQEDNMKPISELKEIDEHQQQQEIVNTSTQTKIVGEIPSIDNSNKTKSNKAVVEDENGNVSKVMLNNSSESPQPPTSLEGPISIQIVTSKTEESVQQNNGVKLPVVSKVHISHKDDETVRSGSDEEEEEEEEEEDEMTVNIYNVSTKSVVTSEKTAIIKETNSSSYTNRNYNENEKKVSVIQEKHVIIENNNNNHNIVMKEETIKTVVRRSPSPEWTYTLPPAPVLNSMESINSNGNNNNNGSNDKNIHNHNNNNSPTEPKSIEGNKFFSDYTSTVADNETILSDSNTTVVSAETHIQPIINDRRKALDDSFIVDSINVEATTADNQSDKSAEIITSDLEDGYLGNNKKITTDNDNEISVIEEVSTPKSIVEIRGREIITEDFQKNRLIVTRSDSFHSIGQQKRLDYELTRRSNVNAVPQRSTSFLSLVHSQKTEMRASTSSTIHDLNVPYSKQKSTSELSISDVPSLQSLEVIKNILNCRKSSLQDSPQQYSIRNDDDDKSALSDDISVRKHAAPIVEEPKNNSKNNSNNVSTNTLIEAKSAVVPEAKIEVKSYAANNNNNNNAEKVIYNNTIEKKDIIIKKLETQKSEPVAEYNNNNKNNNDGNSTKKSETMWRYSGPPKINFSTWNERPKVEVSVMNDEDYIFGGVGASTLPRDSRNQQGNNNSSSSNSQNQSDYVDSVLLRKANYSTVIVTKENKEAERNVPKILGVEYKKDVNPVVVMSKHSETSNIHNNNSNDISNNSKTLISIKQYQPQQQQQQKRPISLDYNSVTASSTKTTISSPNYQNQFVSYNRLITNNSNNKNNNNNNIGINKKFTPIVHGFSKLDNISETQSDVKSLPITNKITIETTSEKKAEAPVIPAKPSYLRSTSAGDINRNMQKLSPVIIKATTPDNNTNDEASSYDEKPFSQSLRRTGLIEKMLNNDKKTESIFGRVLDKPKNANSVTISNHINSSNVNQENAGEEKIERVTYRHQFSLPSKTPPPPPLPSTAVFRKSAPVSTGENDADTRNQLLDAIKNFNKDSLRRK